MFVLFFHKYKNKDDNIFCHMQLIIVKDNKTENHIKFSVDAIWVLYNFFQQAHHIGTL